MIDLNALAQEARAMSACVGHDPRICEASREYERKYPVRYEIRIGLGRWRRVTRAEWISAERSAGFHNTMGHDDEPGTGGFSNSLIAGRIIATPSRSALGDAEEKK